ncbi:MAG: ribulose-phosphate 3-epimerase [Proteobacteria bacterium]|nr:ribulose-phosphate 3-epimerase [Pseudomonadota bacterium]
MPIVSPSILSANFTQLESEIKSVSNADWLHIDVMDGHFVPNITIGPPVLASIRKITNLPLDVHLMITEPDRFLSQFKEAGADIITVHVEACTHLNRTIQCIHQLGAKAGVALNPHTPEHTLDYVLDQLDLVLLMSVNPGFGGQKLIEGIFPKIERVRQRIDSLGLKTLIEIDGGVKSHNAHQFFNAGAHALVSGSGIFGSKDRTAEIDKIRSAGQELI